LIDKLNNNAILLLASVILLTIDYYDTVLPSPSMIGGLYVKSKIKVCLYLFYITAKRKFLPILLSLVFSIMLFIYDKSSIFQILLILIIAVTSPLLSYYPLFRVGRYVLFSLVLISYLSKSVFLRFMIFLLVIGLLLFLVNVLVKKGLFLTYKRSKCYLKSWRKTLLIILVAIPVLVVINPIFERLPIEQGLLMGILLICYQLEAELLTNENTLLVSRARAFLNVVKSDKINISFFRREQFTKMINYFGVLFMLLIVIALRSKLYVELFILLFGVLILIISNLDLYLYHFIFQRSVVYENKITRYLVGLVINFLAFQYAMYYSVVKLLPDMVMPIQMQIFYQIVSFIFFLVLLLVFVKRYKKVFDTRG